VQVGQADAEGLADGGELGLLVLVEHDGLGQLPLQRGVAFLQVAGAPAQVLPFLVPGGAVEACPHPVGFAVDALAADAALAGVAADVPVAATKDGGGTGNPGRRRYDGHG